MQFAVDEFLHDYFMVVSASAITAPVAYLRFFDLKAKNHH